MAHIMENKVYLGNGTYVEWDEIQKQFILCQVPDRKTEQVEIFINDEVLKNLQSFVRSITTLRGELTNGE